jgi:hypothetical protein
MSFNLSNFQFTEERDVVKLKTSIVNDDVTRTLNGNDSISGESTRTNKPRSRTMGFYNDASGVIHTDSGDDIIRGTAVVPPPNILMVGWDGVQWDHLNEAYDKKLRHSPDGLPNLKVLSSGRLFRNIVTNGDPSTKPGWVQLMTGYTAERTGVLSKFEFRPIDKGLTVFEKAQFTFGRDNVNTFLLSGKRGMVGNDCSKGEPWCRVAPELDRFENYLGLDSIVGRHGLRALEDFGRDPFVGLIHFYNPDHAGHDHGENSRQYTKALVRLDQWLGRYIDKLKELDVFDNTVIYVISDHGFNEGGHGHHFGTKTFMATNDTSVIRAGDRMDIAPTVLTKLGISLGRVGNAPPVDGYSLTHIPGSPRLGLQKGQDNSGIFNHGQMQTGEGDDRIIGKVQGSGYGIRNRNKSKNSDAQINTGSGQDSITGFVTGMGFGIHNNALITTGDDADTVTGIAAGVGFGIHNRATIAMGDDDDRVKGRGIGAYSGFSGGGKILLGDGRDHIIGFGRQHVDGGRDRDTAEFDFALNDAVSLGGRGSQGIAITTQDITMTFTDMERFVFKDETFSLRDLRHMD